MSPTPLLHPDIGHPLVFGWPRDIPLPSLITDSFPANALYPIRLLQIIIGPNMDAAADAALHLFLGTRLVPNLECVSVVFHAGSFTPHRLSRVQQYLGPSCVWSEIRVLDPTLQTETTTIQVINHGQPMHFWFLVIPADGIDERLANDLSASSASLNLKIIPPLSPQTFLNHYDLILSRLIDALRSTTHLQRLSFPLDFLLKDAKAAEVVFDILRSQPQLEELELHVPAAMDLDAEGTRVAVNELAKTFTLESRFLSRLKRFAVPVRFIRTRLLSIGNNPASCVRD
ncbi:hypothetical protein GALMADRAFT_724023 [Galerina marginata CBS 339.88]|uniref:Uncharacterized protein n=1 Tax=Galerina marginata (strain CBS 339.88) TaxID=685588 RepID=A0A067SQL0_GALM3|nr:hypothetical protein GALMADRAFT_724023 [Galerina marginata CBS 339.88]